MFRLDISSFGVVAFAMPFLLVDAAKRRVAFFKETSHWCVEFRYLLKKKNTTISLGVNPDDGLPRSDLDDGDERDRSTKKRNDSCID